ncbi:hypothetical protein INR49_024759 [Caranx melampygus]|nr:hypothetical protein INR49_024759 [Caranx melampygus]
MTATEHAVELYCAGICGLPSSTTDQSSAAEAAHIQPSNTQANGILEQIRATSKGQVEEMEG